MKRKQTAVRFTEKEKAMLEKRAKELGVSQTIVMRMYIVLGDKLFGPETLDILRGIIRNILQAEADNET